MGAELKKLGHTMQAWQLRDLRRTAWTLLARRAGVLDETGERYLAHIIQGVRGVYDIHDLFDLQDNVVPIIGSNVRHAK